MAYKKIAWCCGLTLAAWSATTAAEPTDDAIHTEAAQEKRLTPDEVRELQQQISVLRREVASLRARQATASTAPPEPIYPVFVRRITDNGLGFNDSNPVWSRDGKLLGFERSEERKREITITSLDGDMVQKIAFAAAEDDLDLGLLLPGFEETVTYNAGLTWSPQGDRFIFMSNGAEGNYDLYLGSIGNETMSRLTSHNEKEGQADWSPTRDQVLYISGESGNAHVYLLDVPSGKVQRVTNGVKPYLYPQWSPDGKAAALIYGSNQNHDIYVIRDISRPFDTIDAVTAWHYDDLRPVWSPDGSKIAFYTNYNRDNDPKLWSIAVVAADARNLTEATLVDHIVATHVVPDVDRGPAWMPNSRQLVYVKNEGASYNPIHIVDSETKRDRLIETKTRINHDISCSSGGLIAFRSQVDAWDQIFVAKLKDEDS